uniref:Putative adaptor protein nub1 n=1 Tax=Ixodes ricinus TaxID=34613 RepID=A0A0K8RMC1_IXORI
MDEQNIASVRNKLNSENIKLWLPPYTVDGSEGNFPTEMVERYAAELKLDVIVVLNVLRNLRNHAVTKLASNQKFKTTGVATLKVKIVNPQQKSPPRKEFESIEINLDENGKKLRELVASKCSVDSGKIKLISAGKVIQDTCSLKDQSVKNHGQLLALFLTETVQESLEKERKEMELNKIREDADLLSSVDADDPDNRYYMQIADQTGKPIPLPVEERKALGLAMVLHEKGRSAMKRKEYSEALILFLEADKEFGHCNSELLKSVDNYALLCLDITWCYLSLQSVNQLFDAEARLKACEMGFHRCYGENLERLTAIKGGSDKEAALYSRLYLLQGIVAFHQQQYPQAQQYLERAASTIARLKVDDEAMTQIMALGYSATEARLGLRSAGGNIDLAVQYIISQHEEREAQLGKEEAKKKRRRREKRLGKTQAGEWVNAEHYDTLRSMGFSSSQARRSLQQANNDINLAVQIMQDTPLGSTSSGSSGFVPLGHEGAQGIPESMLAQLLALGFDLESVNEALARNNGDLDAAVSELMADNDMEHGFFQNEEGRDEKEREALERLTQDISGHEEDFLDATLEEELLYLKEYRTKLVELGF